MSNANICVLIGNLTKDPEIKQAGSGQVATLSLAINRSYKDKNTGELVKNTDFINVSVWNKQAESCVEYLAKGQSVYIEGRLVQKKWEDKEGNNRSRLEVVASRVQFLSKPKNSAVGSEAKEVEEKMF